jgi:hypothetical protein
MIEFMKAINGANFVYYNEDDHLCYVWFGGVTIKVFNDEGDECDVITMMYAPDLVGPVLHAIASFEGDHVSDLHNKHQYYSGL